MTTLLRHLLYCLFPVLLSASLATAQAAEPTAHKFHKLADGVYLAEWTQATLNSNTLVIINEHDVLIFDSHNELRGARLLVEDIKTLTDKPIKYVVNSHFHFDHANGNEAFAPDVEVIASVFTHHILANNPLQGRTAMQFWGPGASQAVRHEITRKQAEAEPDAAKKAVLLKNAADQEATVASYKASKPRAASIVVPEKLVLHRGGREIQIIFPGRGHTGGDLLLYLPKEKVVATGDFLENIPSCCGFSGDFYPEDYARSMQVLAKLDFNVIVPGHGGIISGDAGKKKVAAYEAYLKDFVAQVSAFKKQGLSALEASKKLDMTAHKTNFPNARGPADFKGDQPDQAVARFYELADGKDYYGAVPY